MRAEEVWPEEISLHEPLIFESEVAGNLAWNVDPPGFARLNSNSVAGVDDDARAVMFDTPGVYKLTGHSVFPLPVLSNKVTIRVE